MIEKYNLKDPALECMAKIIHGADISADIDITPESAGLKAIAFGFHYLVEDDYKKMELEFPVYDALYEYCKNKVTKKE